MNTFKSQKGFSRKLGEGKGFFWGGDIGGVGNHSNVHLIASVKDQHQSEEGFMVSICSMTYTML